jgi:glycosyltransferase involved in cell wall biosynthesis
MQLSEFVSRRIPSDPSVVLDKNDYPKISLITPSYGQEAFIERTILSVLNQNYPNLEYIIVDDASKDNSNAIIRKYGDEIILLSDGINRGQTAAINHGFRHATGDIIGFQNADDLFEPNAFFELAKAYKESPESSLFFGNIHIVDENDAITNTMRMTPYSYVEHLYLGMQMHNQAMFWKPSIFKDYGYFDENYNYSFDYEFMCRYTEDGKSKPRYVEGFWGAFRIHSTSKTTLITPAYSNERTRISEHYRTKGGINESYKLIRIKSYLRKAIYFLKTGHLSYMLSRLG